MPFLHNDVLDAALKEVANNGDIAFINSQLPANYVQASVTYALGSVSLTPGHGNDYTIADASPNGRKVTPAQKTAVPITANGTANFVSICDSATQRVLLVYDLTSPQSVTVGGTVALNFAPYIQAAPVSQ